MPFNQIGNFKLLYNLKPNNIALSTIDSRYTVDIELKAISYIPPGKKRIEWVWVIQSATNNLFFLEKLETKFENELKNLLSSWIFLK